MQGELCLTPFTFVRLHASCVDRDPRRADCTIAPSETQALWPHSCISADGAHNAAGSRELAPNSHTSPDQNRYSPSVTRYGCTGYVWLCMHSISRTPSPASSSSGTEG